jgi:energy-coupling factor transporter ATP-binding protein EcfA2
MHLDDEDTTWFGIARDANDLPIFQDYGRYATIIANSSTGEYKVRYPQLVSFIGQTGAGKSTIVKMLIDQQERVFGSRHSSAFPSPVVGSVRNENVPTSGDVHLYGDPNTYLGQYPMLYADCEGLEGGENMPISAQYCNGSIAPSSRKRTDSNTDRKRHKIARVTRGTQRDITWADCPEKQKRQYAVTELYPRLLYTFSDVIVFVLRNPK